MSTFKQNFAKAMRSCREFTGLSQVELSKGVQVNRSTISRAEKEDHMYIPGASLFFKIKRVLEAEKCDSRLLQRFQEVWEQAQTVQDKSNGEIDPRLQYIINALDKWPQLSPERTALVEDLEAIAANWQSFWVASQDLKEGNLISAESSLTDLVVTLDAQPKLKMYAMVALARTRRYLGKAEEAIPLLEQALNIVGASAHRERAEILLDEGNFYRRLGQLNDALDSYDRSGEEFVKVKEVDLRNTGIATVKRKIGGTLLFRGEAKKAQSLLLESIRLCQAAGDMYGLRKGEQQLAWAYALLGKYDKALELHKHALDTIDDPRISLIERAKTERYYADALRMCRKLDEAIMWYKRALMDFRKHSSEIEPDHRGDFLIRGPILIGLGQIYLRLGEYIQAEAYLIDSKNANGGDPFFLGRTLSAFGVLYSKWRGDYEGAKAMFDEAHRLFIDRPNAYYTTAILVNRAELECLLGTLAEGRRWAQKAIEEAANKEELAKHRMRAHLLLANINLLEQGDEDPVDEYRMAFRIAEEMDNLYLCSEVLDTISQQLEKLKEAGKRAELERICSAITNNWQKRDRSGSLEIQAMLESWTSTLHTLTRTESTD